MDDLMVGQYISFIVCYLLFGLICYVGPRFDLFTLKPREVVVLTIFSGPIFIIDALLFILVTIPQIPKILKSSLKIPVYEFKTTYFKPTKKLAQNYIDQLKADGYSEEEIKEVIGEMKEIENV